MIQTHYQEVSNVRTGRDEYVPCAPVSSGGTTSSNRRRRNVIGVGTVVLLGSALGWSSLSLAAPPQASCTINPQDPTVSAGGTVTWSASSSQIKGSPSYTWSFGGGDPASSTNPTETVAYGTPGTYTTSLTVSGSRSGTADCSTQVTVTGGGGNTAPTCNIIAPTENVVNVGKGGTVNWSGVVQDADGNLATIQWTFGGGSPASASTPIPNGSPTTVDTGPFTVTYNNPGTFTTTLQAMDTGNQSCSQAKTVQVTQTPPTVSINSSSQSCGLAGQPACSNQAVAEQPAPGTPGGAGTYRLLVNNDLGMHCGDLDTRIAGILPPFNVLHAQVIRAGGTGNVDPALNPTDIAGVFYSAASNPNDPALATGVTPVPNDPNAVYKTNFWDIAIEAYDPFYPASPGDPFKPTFNLTMNPDEGLPVPDLEALYILGEALSFNQQNMPGIADPYSANDPQPFALLVGTQPFFSTYFGVAATPPGFGYDATVNWWEAAGVPISVFDDFGRENSYPVMRIQAKDTSGTVVATTDTVMPISAEADCQTCHGDISDGGNGLGVAALTAAGIGPQVAFNDPQYGDVPLSVSNEWAADQNILKLHDLENPTAPRLITGTTEDFPTAGDTPFKSVVCQTCHYTPALDLAQVGPNDVNGRQQSNNQTMSRVMHDYHGLLDANGKSPGDTGYDNSNLLFPLMPAPSATEGPSDPLLSASLPENQAARLDVLDQTCYRCHPGDRTQCLRGAMYTGGMLCQDCHGNMTQVGNDFSKNMPDGSFIVAGDFYGNGGAPTTTPRVPWANEPGCGSCHTGDFANDGRTTDPNNPINTPGSFVVNATDNYGNSDNLRLIQAYTDASVCSPGADPAACPKMTPIVPSNKRFAEVTVGGGKPTEAPSGNPKLYRVSTGHSGVLCEGCHGSTHAEWPNANPNANDNLTATQLQGHSGLIAECSTCHTNEWDNTPTLNGPHGLHPIGANTPFANKSVHGSPTLWPNGTSRSAYNDTDYVNNCKACHGGDSRSTSTGTVLSRTFAQRTLKGNTLAKGTPVACPLCHKR